MFWINWVWANHWFILYYIATLTFIDVAKQILLILSSFMYGHKNEVFLVEKGVRQLLFDLNHC